jgi:adenosylmethionine-8-amino-7-oxononanoate aminotransferase
MSDEFHDNQYAKRLADMDKECLWHPFTPMRQWMACPDLPGLIIEAGEGFHLITATGKRYIDGFSSLWCNLHGHRVAQIDAAIRGQLAKIAHSTLLGFASPPSIELAARLVDIAPPGLTKVFLSDSGATAVEIAIKMAFQYFQNIGQLTRRRFIAFRESYHGDTIGSVSVGGIDLFHSIFKPLLFEATFVDSPNPYHFGSSTGILPVSRTGVPPVASSSSSSSSAAAASAPSAAAPSFSGAASAADDASATNHGQDARATHGRDAHATFDAHATIDAHATVLGQIDRELSRHPSDYAAVIIEPLIQAAAGMLTHPDGFLRDLRELTRRYGVLLIADEVATGFCRTGKMFACEHEGVTPDLLCLGKGLSGGYLPVAATLASGEIFDSFLGRPEGSSPSGQADLQSGYGGKTFFHGHTFTGNALGCAAAVASIDLIKSSGLLESLPAKIALIHDMLAPLADHPHVGDIRQCGMMVGIELVRERPRESYEPVLRMGTKVCQEAMRRGVIIRPLGDVVVLMPAPAMDLATLTTLLDATVASIEIVDW